MVNIIISEFTKLRRLKIPYISITVLSTILIIGVVRWLNIRGIYGSVISWNYFFPLIEIESSKGLFMLLVCMVTAYIFTCDHIHNCMDFYSLCPYSPVKIYLSKLLTAFLYTFANVSALFILNLVSGMFFQLKFYLLTKFLLLHHLKIYFLIFLLLASVIPLVALASSLIKKYTITVLAILVVYYINFQFSQLWVIDKLIWNMMAPVIQSAQVWLNPKFNLMEIENYTPYIKSAVISFLVPLIAGVVFYKKLMRKKRLR